MDPQYETKYYGSSVRILSKDPSTDTDTDPQYRSSVRIRIRSTNPSTDPYRSSVRILSTDTDPQYGSSVRILSTDPQYRSSVQIQVLRIHSTDPSTDLGTDPQYGSSVRIRIRIRKDPYQYYGVKVARLIITLLSFKFH
jgi:hypothetical protein